MDRPTTIDTGMHGLDGITAAYLVRGNEKVALVETGPKSVVDNVRRALRAAGVESLDWIIVTHIHLDHAGAAGSLARDFPDATVAVHEVGAPHLVDPSKLWSSAARIYGDRMEALWGGIDPLPENRVHVLQDGDSIDLGGRVLQAVETPGHAYHHHAYVDDATGIVFTGDAVGVRLPDVGLVRPATPPPEFHLDKALASIDRIASLEPSELWLTHFGPHSDGERVSSPAELCEESKDAFVRWGEWVRAARERTTELDEASRLVRAEASRALEQDLDPAEVARMDQTTSYEMNVWGYMRYFDKQAAAQT